ncbi:MAG: hypothetical protein V4568_18320 [Pseudomonadota bacterium]
MKKAEFIPRSGSVENEGYLIEVNREKCMPLFIKIAHSYNIEIFRRKRIAKAREGVKEVLEVIRYA